MKSDTPWWWPTVINDEHLQRLRDDYPEDTRGKDDEELLDYYDDGKTFGHYSTTWDHTGDAYAEYRQLADAFLKLCKEAGKSPSDFTA